MRLFRLLPLAVLFLSLAAHAGSVPRTIPLLLREQTDEGKVKRMSCFKKNLLAYFEREMNIRFAVQYLPFRRAEQLMLKGEGLLWGMPAIPPEEDPGKEYLFSEPVYKSYAWMVVRKNFNTRIESINDLKGLKLSTFYGVSYSPEFEQQRGKLFTVEEEPDSGHSRLNKLLIGRVDVLLMHSRHTTAEALMKSSSKYLPELNQLEILPHPLQEMQIRFALGRKALQPGNDWSRDLLADLNRAIARGQKTGAIQRIVSDSQPCS